MQGKHERNQPAYPTQPRRNQTSISPSCPRQPPLVNRLYCSTWDTNTTTPSPHRPHKQSGHITTRLDQFLPDRALAAYRVHRGPQALHLAHSRIDPAAKASHCSDQIRPGSCVMGMFFISPRDGKLDKILNRRRILRPLHGHIFFTSDTQGWGWDAYVRAGSVRAQRVSGLQEN